MLLHTKRLVAAGVGTPWMDSDLEAATSFPQQQASHHDLTMSDYHIPVLMSEVLRYMAPSEGTVMVDGTLGGGGHTEAMLKAGATVIGVDQDDQALEYAKERLSIFGDRFTALRGNFATLPSLLAEAGYEKVDAILVDIGVSSWQLDEADRGFSFGKEGPLDMRMDRSGGNTAADLVNGSSEEELKTIFREYGEERAAGRIARRMVERREKKPFSTTLDLADFICSIIPRGGKSHPATRIFQALRIAVNDELGVLRTFLENASTLLRPGGRVVVITFHSLEDRIVKQFFKHASLEEIDRKEWPAPRPNPDYQYKLLTRRPVVASGDELQCNKRARSAKLRAVEKI
jgi:16S rRNA (cytosine1402-N4)-methyltransferase